jgi:hypothetical protein
MSILLPPNPSPSLPEPLWLPSPESPGLPVNELHIWRACLREPRWTGDDDEEEESDSDPGCPISRDRAEKLKTAFFHKDILGRYTGHENTAPSGPAGAPPRFPGILPGPASGLRLAFAQCDHLALIAVSRDIRALGLDVERVRDDIPIEEMAGGFLDAHSQWDLRVTWSLQEKAWKFFQFWTSNEACSQARPSSISIHTCQVMGFSPEAGFIAARALEGGPQADVLYWDWNG